MRVIHGELNVVTDSIWGDFTDGQKWYAPRAITSKRSPCSVTIFTHDDTGTTIPWRTPRWSLSNDDETMFFFLPWNIAGSYPLGNNGGILKLLGIQWEYHSILILVGGLEHEFYDVPFSWEFHSPNWRTHSFQRGGYTTNQNQIRSLIC